MAFESTPLRLAIRDKMVEAFLAVSVGGVISHDDIANTIGEDTSSPCAIKHAALRLAASEYGAVFENVRGVGYRRIRAGEIHRVGRSARQSIRNKARRSSGKMVAAMAVNSNSMSNEERLRVHSEVGLLGIIQVSAGSAAANRAYRSAEAAHGGKKAPPTHDEIVAAVAAVLRAA